MGQLVHMLINPSMVCVACQARFLLRGSLRSAGWMALVDLP